jgi:ribosomal protein L7/L12
LEQQSGDSDIRQALADGRKIEAIKLHRERYGTGLAEAKAAVEAMETGVSLPPPSAPDSIEPQVQVFWSEVDDLIRQGQKIQAIKRYRQQFGCGLKDAKDAIDQRAIRIGAPTSAGGGCFIATAAFGTELAPEVGVLREFRDRSLLATAPGRRAVRLYYRLSPALAEAIAPRPALRATVRAMLRPVVAACRFLHRTEARRRDNVT